MYILHYTADIFTKQTPFTNAHVQVGTPGTFLNNIFYTPVVIHSVLLKS